MEHTSRRGRFNTAPTFVSNELDLAVESVEMAAVSRHKSHINARASVVPSSAVAKVSRSRSGTVIVSGFICPLCKDQLASKEALLAHRCGQSQKQSLAQVRTTLRDNVSMRLTPEALQQWAEHGTPHSSISSSVARLGGASEHVPVRRPSFGSSAVGNLDSNERFSGRSFARRSTVSGYTPRTSPTSASAVPAPSGWVRAGDVNSGPVATFPPDTQGNGEQPPVSGEEEQRQGQQTTSITGFICPQCKTSLPGKRELLLHRCRDSRRTSSAAEPTRAGEAVGSHADNASGDNKPNKDEEPLSAVEKKRQERRRKFE